METQERRFPLGKLVSTQGVAEEVDFIEMLSFASRHGAGDWGDVSPEDARANETALQIDARIVSAYHSKSADRKVWIITEADRSSTCVLFPEEY